MKKILIGLAMFALLVMPSVTLATGNEADALLWGGEQTNVENELGLGAEDPRVIIASIINVVLGFLGIVAVVIIILGGFKWMTAAGNEDKIDEAKKLITAGIIGLVIIMAAWGIATFVMEAVYSATGATG
jgi:ketopantoate hydroxymethyltransferase